MAYSTISLSLCASCNASALSLRIPLDAPFRQPIGKPPSAARHGCTHNAKAGRPSANRGGNIGSGVQFLSAFAPRVCTGNIEYNDIILNTGINIKFQIKIYSMTVYRCRSTTVYTGVIVSFFNSTDSQIKILIYIRL